MRRIVVSVVLAAVVWFIAPSNARADMRLFGSGQDGCPLALVVGAAIVSPLLSVVATTVNAASWAGGVRPDWRWTLLGDVLAVVSAIVGAALLKGSDEDGMGAGVGLLGWGGLSMVVGIGAALQPEPRLAVRY